MLRTQPIALAIALALALAIALCISRTPPAGAQGCRFVLGFATLQRLMPGVVGDCVEDEHHNPANGDAVQRTTRGLLVWRRADNVTAFTDGHRTWLNGPFGPQQRLNRQRLWWEPNPDGLPVVPAPRPGDPCHTAGLDLRLDGLDPGAGNVVGTFRLMNRTAVSCTLFGYPGAQLLDARFGPLPTRVVRGGGFLGPEPGPQRVAVEPGESALFRLHWGQVPVGDEPDCPEAGHLAVIPPDEYAPLLVPVTIRACGGGLLNVGAVRPAP